jgi:hypothetical protein
MQVQEVLNLMRRTDKYSESNIESAPQTQILQQQKQLNGRNHHMPLNINTECYWTQLPHQKTCFGNCIKKEDLTICFL